MAVKYKWLVKCYWKVENVVEVQRRWRVQFGTPLPTRATITRIPDKVEVDGKVQDVLKVGAEEREVRPITTVLMQSCRFFHDTQRSQVFESMLS